MVIPGFLATDRTTLGLQRALAEAGYRVAGWGLGLNSRRRGRTRSTGSPSRSSAFGGGRPVILVGWSLGGIYRPRGRQAPARSRRQGGDARLALSRATRAHNNVWRLYELVAGHPVDDPPIDADPAAKPPVPTLAIWSRRDGIVAPACARGERGRKRPPGRARLQPYGLRGQRPRPIRRIVEAIRELASLGHGRGSRHLLRAPQRPAASPCRGSPRSSGPHPRLAVLADELDMAVEAGAARRLADPGPAGHRLAGADGAQIVDLVADHDPDIGVDDGPAAPPPRQCAVAMSWIQRTQTALLTWPSSSMSSAAR